MAKIGRPPGGPTDRDDWAPPHLVNAPGPRVVVTRPEALDNLPPSTRFCGWAGPYEAKTEGGPSHPALCTRPSGHPGNHQFSTLDHAGLAEWTQDGNRVRPIGTGTVIIPKRRPASPARRGRKRQK